MADEMNEYAAAPVDHSLSGDVELLSLVQRELDAALGWVSGTRLAEKRRANLKAYFGDPTGDEREGRSQVVTRDVFEQVEMLMPQLMEIFTSGSEIGRFIPTGPEDEEAAEQATAVANHVLRSQDGFMALYTFFKDALIQKNGILKVFYDDGGVATFEDYEGKNFMELQALMSSDDLIIQGVEAWVEGPDGSRQVVNPDQAGQDITSLFFDVRAIRKPQGRIELENIPPEEFIINRDARSLSHRSCRFVGHRSPKTVSELVEIGVDLDVAQRLPQAFAGYAQDQDVFVRASQDDGNPMLKSDRKDSEKVVMVTEAYLLADRDGDGISEWYKVLVGGDYGTSLLSVEQVDGHPFCSVTPVPIPHRFYGLGLADIVTDIQAINKSLWRQFLDSNYLSIDPSYVVLSQGIGESAIPMVNLNQLVNTRPGSYVEEYAPGALRPLERTSNAKDILPAFEVHSQMKERRTGLSPEAMGIAPESISKHVFGAMVQTSANAQRVSLYARIFADTGVKDLFRLIYKEYLKRPNTKTTVRLRGDWVQIDPSSWKDNWDVEITVGLGHGSRMEKVANLQAIGAMQQTIAGLIPGMVTPDHAFNTFAETVEAMGFKDATKFIIDPAATPLPEPPPDPAEVALEFQRQIEAMKIEVQRQKVEVDRYRAQIEAKVKELEHEREIKKMALEGKKIEYDAKQFDINKAAASSSGSTK